MVRQFSLIFLLILCCLVAIYAFLSRPLVCLDPAGCIWSGPDDPVEIGVSVFTSGVDRPLSLEIQRSLELFAQNSSSLAPDHPLKIQTYYSACLPNTPVQSTIDLSADSHILAVIGPICGEDSTNFAQRMLSANKITISPVPFQSPPNEAGFTINPDINQLANQTAVWIQSMGFSRIIITHDIDNPSSSFSAEMCDYFRSYGTCIVESPGSSEPQPEAYDAAVEVFFDESNPPLTDSISTDPAHPTIVVSFSRPGINSHSVPTFFWIGPQFWNENKNFSAAYYSAYNSYPTSFASWVLYDRLPMIYNTIRETAVANWDGSWMIPAGQLKQHLAANFKQDDIFCLASSSDCPKLSFVVYRVSGNEYTLFKP